MSSEEEATAANVLSQMSQIQQISPCETIDATVVVGHHCDVETTNTQENSQETTVEVSPEVLQQVQAAFQHELPQLAAAGFVAVTKADDVSEQHHSIIQDHGDHGVHVVNEGMQCTTCSKPGKSYTCEHCGKKFNKSYNLKTHIRVHTGERPYQCDVCGHGFANLGDLKRHTRTHTGEKPFKCEFCGKVFSDFGSHKRHLRLHTGYKPFKCEQCDREFTRLDSFKNHLRLHTGDRPYKCVTCSKEFNYLTTYKRHLNIHKGEKPYACDLCDKKFTRQNYLKNHMNTHTKITSQECQTDTGIMIHTTGDGDQETMETSEGQTAAANLSKVSLSQLVDQADEKATMVEQDDGKTEGFSKSSDSKINESLLQQVTQVLGEIIPQNVSAELTDSADGQQIVVQGGDQAGGEFKVTLAQQLLIAQHILNQAQLRTGNHGNEDSGSNTVTTLSIPEITPEIAEQIVNQVAMQHERQTGDAIISHDNIQVIEVSGTQSDDSSQAIQEHLITQQITKEMGPHDLVTEQVMEESGVTMTTSPSVQGAVYVAIDPTQPDMQQYLGEIQVLQSSANENTAQADKHS